MNITKQIVERHDGRVDYESALGEGSTFYVEFDRIPQGDKPEVEDEPMAALA